MQKGWKAVLIISIVINLVLGYILISEPRSIETNPNVYTEKIDSLGLELNALKQIRDSIRSSIDTITIEINNNKESYEETRDIILSNSVDNDYLFFTDYLRKNKERLDSINNP